MRAVTLEHVLFDECIKYFHPGESDPSMHIAGGESAFLLLDFELPEEWLLPGCVVKPSKKFDIGDLRAVFISELEITTEIPYKASEMYATALATVLSFSTGRLCKSPPRHYHSKMDVSAIAAELALDHPIKIIGPGSVQCTLSKDVLGEMHKKTAQLIDQLYSLPYDRYLDAMQAVRLVNLSLVNKGVDFGLAYLLIVSSIEVAAQKAISVEGLTVYPKSLERWNEIKDPDFMELLEEYKAVKARDKHLARRYRNFIKKYCPPSNWEKMLAHPLDRRFASDEEREVWYKRYRIDQEVLPSNLNSEKINAIINESYRHRSSFVHEGAQPPHREPVASSRCFQVVTYLGSDGMRQEYLPNYELMYFIAQTSILKWIFEG